MSAPVSLELDCPVEIDGLDRAIHAINTGVPHTVTFVETLADFNVVAHGRAIRRHPHFAPRGTNANFAETLAPGHLAIRTYERGVEGETLACGTGMVACALIHHLADGAPSPVRIDVRGGDTLEIGFERDADGEFSQVTLTGPADFVFEGDIEI
jgi:diaminopimelate epimerase